MNDSELYLLLLKIIGFLVGWSMIFTIPWIRIFVRMFKYGIHNGGEEGRK